MNKYKDELILLVFIVASIVVGGKAKLLFLIVGIAVYINAKWKKKKLADIESQYGSEIAQKVQNKTPELGMKRDIVKLMWGQEYDVTSTTNTKGRFDTVYYIKDTQKSKPRKYAIFQDDVLIEYGDN